MDILKNSPTDFIFNVEKLMLLKEKTKQNKNIQTKQIKNYSHTPVQYTAIFHGCKNDYQVWEISETRDRNYRVDGQ